jgi:hypothetical protein
MQLDAREEKEKKEAADARFVDEVGWASRLRGDSRVDEHA